ncbi:hypothetical protein OSTOST_05824 [Ostertagia ostertagi]
MDLDSGARKFHEEDLQMGMDKKAADRGRGYDKESFSRAADRKRGYDKESSFGGERH